jgi:hypothetical protein
MSGMRTISLTGLFALLALAHLIHDADDFGVADVA